MKINLIWIKNFLIVLFITLFSVKVLDLIVGIYNPYYSYISPAKRFISLRELGEPGTYDVVLKKEDMKYLSKDIKNNTTRSVTINKDGYIIGPKEPLEPQKSYDIIFLGGSTTETLHVNEEFRFPYVAGIEIEKLTNKKIKTLNGGVFGSNSMHNNIKLLANVIKYKPKAVVLMNNMNDWRLLSFTNSYFDVPDAKLIVDKFDESNIFEELKKLIKKGLNFFVPNIFNNYVMKLIQKYLQGNDEFIGYRKPNLNLVEDMLPKFSNSIQTFINICKTWNIKPVLMTQMSLLEKEIARKEYLEKHKNTFDMYEKYQKKFNDEIRRLAKLNDIDLVDLDHFISGKKDMIYDEIHLNDKGSVYAGKIIAKTLSKYFIN